MKEDKWSSFFTMHRPRTTDSHPVEAVLLPIMVIIIDVVIIMINKRID